MADGAPDDAVGGRPGRTVAISVAELLDRAELAVTIAAGKVGLGREVLVPRIQKPGLALTGWPEQLHANRVLVLGGTEIDYLKDHEPARRVGIETLLASEPACVVVCRSLVPPDELLAAGEARGVPVLVSSLVTADFIAAVTTWMADRLAPSTELHGVLMDVLGIGVLMVGKSGIGKSETALDLVVRGHRLVGDDVIRIRRHGHQLSGRGAGILGHHMEIRGLGIINIKDLFGISAVREAKVIDLIVELHEWDAAVEYDRLGFDEHREKLLDVAITKLRLPVRPGRNIATLIEVAARNQLLKHQGIHSARAFRDTLHRAMHDAEGADAVE
ncbi:MAG TPA: HPr(Ser) kinase/phosphatase [Kofleriaceae bacterium]|nr:HPr(Ser) kinase/phosphatase [Kofleriaceae bacterium]